jgi:hypothetical protein
MWLQLLGEDVCYMDFGLMVEAGNERVGIGISPDSGRVEIELAAPDETRLLAEIDHLFEEALEDIDPEPLPDAGQAGVIGQRLVEGVAEVPTMRQVE